MDAWKKLKIPKIGKGCLKLSFFLWLTHWWIHMCETDWLEVTRTLKKSKNVIKMSSDFNLTVTSWFLGNVRLKPYFNTQCPQLLPYQLTLFQPGCRLWPPHFYFPQISDLPTALIRSHASVGQILWWLGKRRRLKSDHLPGLLTKYELRPCVRTLVICGRTCATTNTNTVMIGKA